MMEKKEDFMLCDDGDIKADVQKSVTWSPCD